MSTVYFSNLQVWKPQADDSEAPKLEYTSPLFRRRLSQITRMTIEVIHNLLESTGISKDTKIIFCSMRGEINREFSINRELIEDKLILPAGFSLSVFNTPVSQATLAFGLKGGYSIIYPSKNKISDAFKAAAATVLCGEENQVIFVYADEKIPEEYNGHFKGETEELKPFAFAGIISAKNQSEKSVEVSSLENLPDSPIAFLQYLMENTNK